jgi:hypothetical protein
MGKVYFTPSVEIIPDKNSKLISQDISGFKIESNGTEAGFKLVNHNYKKHLSKFSRMRISFFIKYEQKWDIDKSFISILGDNDKKLASMNFRVLFGDKNLTKIIKYLENPVDSELWLRVAVRISLSQLRIFQLMLALISPKEAVLEEFSHEKLTIKFHMFRTESPIRFEIRDMEIA